MRYLLLLLILISACSPSRRMARLCARHPQLCRVDSITVRDTFSIPSVEIDTVFYYRQTDTVIVQRGRATVKYFQSRDTVFLQTKCDSILQITERVIQLQPKKPEEQKPWWNQIGAGGWLIIVLGGILLFTLIFRKR